MKFTIAMQPTCSFLCVFGLLSKWIIHVILPQVAISNYIPLSHQIVFYVTALYNLHWVIFKLGDTEFYTLNMFTPQRPFVQFYLGLLTYM